MYLKVTGKEKALEELEKANQLIKEAEKILYHLPLTIGIEVKDDTEDSITADQDNQ